MKIYKAKNSNAILLLFGCGRFFLSRYSKPLRFDTKNPYE